MVSRFVSRSNLTSKKSPCTWIRPCTRVIYRATKETDDKGPRHDFRPSIPRLRESSLRIRFDSLKTRWYIYIYIFLTIFFHEYVEIFFSTLCTSYFCTTNIVQLPPKRSFILLNSIICISTSLQRFTVENMLVNWSKRFKVNPIYVCPRWLPFHDRVERFVFRLIRQTPAIYNFNDDELSLRFCFACRLGQIDRIGPNVGEKGDERGESNGSYESYSHRNRCSRGWRGIWRWSG